MWVSARVRDRVREFVRKASQGMGEEGAAKSQDEARYVDKRHKERNRQLRDRGDCDPPKKAYKNSTYQEGPAFKLNKYLC